MACSLAADPGAALPTGCDALRPAASPGNVLKAAIHARDDERSRLKFVTQMTGTCAQLILIVEDFADAREMYREYLEYSGFRVATACDGREAIEKARALNPDLILMDLSLPGIDGWEATRILKADTATAHLSIIALSAHALAADGQRARDAGCDGFIAKPCLPPELVTEIVKYLAVRGPGAAGAERPARGTSKHR